MQKILFLIGMLGLALGARSQADSTAVAGVFEPSISVGVLYGMSWDDVSFSPIINQEIYNGSRVAAVLRYLSDPHFGIQAELSYEQRGWIEQGADSVGANYQREVQYLEFGAYSHITITRGVFKPLLLMGPFVSYPLSDSETIPPNWDTTARSYYDQELPRRLQYGLSGGVGFELELGRISFQADARYRYSLSNLFVSGTDRLTFSQARGFVAQGTLLFRI